MKSSFDELTDLNLSCTMVKEVVLPQGISEIPEKAFYSCMELEKVEVPGSVDKVGSEAFANCPVLKSVYFDGNSPKSLGVHIITENVFTDEFATVYYSKSTERWDSSYWEDYKLSVLDGRDDTVDKPEEGQGDNPQKGNGGTSGRIPGGVTQRPGTGGTGGASSGGSGGTGSGAVQTSGDTEEEKEDSDITLPKEDKDEEDSIKLKPTPIKSVKYKKNRLVIVLKRIPSAFGYEITYRRKKKEKKKTVTVSGWKNNVVILKRLKRGRDRRKI